MGRFNIFFNVFVMFILIQFSESCGNGNPELCKEGERPSSIESLPRGSRREFLPGGLWFGPRLGRRKRKGAENFQDDDGLNALERLVYSNERAKLQKNGDYLYDVPNIVNTLDAMAIKRRFTPRLGRESEEYDEPLIRNVNYVPRLGRELAQDVYDDSPYGLRRADDDDVRPPNYSPRLGRVVQFSPRLGRELDELSGKDQLNDSRYTRSTTHTDKTSKS